VKLYVVQNGDTMENIASKHGMTIDEFRKMNTNLDENSLTQGMKVKVAIGKQPLKRALSTNQRSEIVHHQAPQAPVHQAPAQPAPVQQAPVQQAPVQQAPVQQTAPVPAQPKVKIEAAEQKPNASAGTQTAGQSTSDYAKVMYPKNPESTSWAPTGSGSYPNFSTPQAPTAVSPASQGNAGTAMSPASQGTMPYFPMGNQGNVTSPWTQGPNQGSMVSPWTQGSNQGNVTSPWTQGPNAGSTISPSTQGSNQGSMVSPWTQGPNAGSVVSPEAQGSNQGSMVSPWMQGPNAGSAISPATQGSNQGSMVSPWMQGPNAGSAISPSTQGSNQGMTSPSVQGSGANPYYPNAVGGAASQKPVYHPNDQMGAKSPYYPQLQPWAGQQPQFPIGHGKVQLDKAYVGGQTAGSKKTMPWTNPQVAGTAAKPQQPQTAPAGSGKMAPVQTDPMGGYPYPFVPNKSQTGKPCNCGGPAPYSPYGNAPVAGYYGGNQPPRPQPMPYWAMPNASAPIYQGGQSGTPKK